MKYIVIVEFDEEYEIEADDEGDAEAIAMERLNDEYKTKDDILACMSCYIEKIDEED